MPRIVLVSCDNMSYPVEARVAKMSKTVQSNVNALGIDLYNGDDKELKVLIPKVKGKVLDKVLEWAVHHKDEAESQGDDCKVHSMWDREFVKVDKDMLFDLARASYYFGNDELLDLTCMTLAENVAGKNVKQMQKYFGIKADDNIVKKRK